ncbi:Thioesterase/thiol ester dehydrase-isomerase [Lindgomyces ingoldianus]|uniref:Thioesterase/thiol ester dehydrase-isomerase n=1 Tax=Lindgomyces ingoldianus TaxID=673940 RepID=A0ACB6Q6Z7_9PLEO|nr:Thioesterase/thiol ester dehydrase-isomerase [Lindgomyces ingoldianus]KAF2462594.1 Thioesterase/thiol ester dehydrase-isomerase [Lindgomyces ingoldianus]
MGSRAQRFTRTAAEVNMTAFEKAKIWFETASMEGYDGHDSMLPTHLTLLSADSSPTPSHPHHSTSVFSLTIPSTLCNMSGTLHGGAVALIFDICTSVSISAVARPGFWDAGHVSRTLNCTYLRPAKEGETVLVESEVVHLGKRMGVVKGTIRGVDDGKVYYTCEHGKACLQAPRL